MLELLIAVGVGGVLLASTLVYAYMPWDLALALGSWLVAGGMALGVPTGFYYHVKLYRALKGRNVLPRRWWLHPTDHHRLLSPQQRPSVLGWFAVGGVGFMLAVFGCVLVAVGVVRSK